jgi:hypothetical protein
MLKKSKIHNLLLKAVGAGITAGLHWHSKVYLRCALEGCCYGIPQVDDEPRDFCMYCGEPNINKSLARWEIKPSRIKIPKNK